MHHRPAGNVKRTDTGKGLKGIGQGVEVMNAGQGNGSQKVVLPHTGATRKRSPKSLSDQGIGPEIGQGKRIVLKCGV